MQSQEQAKRRGLERHRAWMNRRYEDTEGYVKGDLVTHRRDGGQFFLLDRGILEGEDGEWGPAYTYQSATSGEIFTTARATFEAEYRLAE